MKQARRNVYSMFESKITLITKMMTLNSDDDDDEYYGIDDGDINVIGIHHRLK